jgi:hypothetical protein
LRGKFGQSYSHWLLSGSLVPRRNPIAVNAVQQSSLNKPKTTYEKENWNNKPF